MLGDEEIDLATWKKKEFQSKSKVSFKCCECSIKTTILLSSFSKEDLIVRSSS